MRDYLCLGTGLGLAMLLAIGSGCTQEEAKPAAAAPDATETQEEAVMEVAESETPAAPEEAAPEQAGAASGKQTEETKLEDGRKVVSTWDAEGMEMAYYDAEGNLVAKEVAVHDAGAGTIASAEVFNGAGELIFAKKFVYDDQGDAVEVVYSKPDGAVWYIMQYQDEGEHKFLDAGREEIAKDRLEAEGFILDPFALQQ